MKRRAFITLLGGAAAWPLAARAQQSATPVIGFLHSGSSDTMANFTSAFREGLRESGYVEGRNVVIEYRWAEDRLDRLPSLAADLLNRKVAVILANGPAALALKAATTTIPIVFMIGSDPVRFGLVPSLNRPGGNATGVAFFTGLLGVKRLGQLRELVPNAAVIAVLLDANQYDSETQEKDAEAAGRTIDRETLIMKVSSEREFNSAFMRIVEGGAGALLVGNSPFFTGHRRQLVALAVRHSLPTSYTQRDFVDAGGLISYGASISGAYRQGGIYTARVLKGAKPGDLPIEQPSRFEFVINLGTAKALDLGIPPTLLALADEVIE